MDNHNVMNEPLRARGVGELLDETFRLYRHKFSFLLLSAVCILIPYHIVTGFIQVRFGLAQNANQFSQLLKHLGAAQQSATTLSGAGVQPPSVQMLIWTYGIVLIYVLLVSPLLFGIILRMTTQTIFNREQTHIGDASSYAFRRIVPNLVTMLFLIVLYMFTFAVIGLIVGLLAVALSAAGIAKAAVVAIAVVVGCGGLILSIWLMVRVSFVPAVVIAEKRMFWGPIARSWVLTKRSFWRLVGYFLMLYLLTTILRAAIVYGLLYLVPNVYVSLTASAVVNIFVLPFTMLATAVMYTDLRIRTDGLDYAPIAHGSMQA